MRIEAARAIKAELRRDAAARIDRQAVPAPPSEIGAAPDGWGVAVGVCVLGDGSYGLAVRYSRDTRHSREVITRARALAGAECDVREVGQIRATGYGTQDSEPSPWDPAELQARVRPLRPGASVAHTAVTAGTIGAFVTAEGAGEVHVLSNNHVLAASGSGAPGDAVLQPGPADGGTDPDDRVGTLALVAELRRDRPNIVDAATALLDPGVEVDPDHPAGRLSGWAEADDDLVVEKVGRTTGLTRGRITAVELDDVAVSFPGGPIVFDDQIEVAAVDAGAETVPFSAGGDSGSLVYLPDTALAIGLLFAGSERGGPGGTGLTYCNRIGAVLDQLQVRLLGEPAADSPPTGDRQAARSVKEELAIRLRDDPRVNGVGIMRWHGRYAVRVNLVDVADAPELPALVHGVEVRAVVVGRIWPAAGTLESPS